MKIRSVGGYFGERVVAGDAELRRPASSSTPTAPSSSSARAAASRTTKAASRSATCSTARRAGCGSRSRARNGSRTSDPRTRRAREPTRRPDAEPTGLTTTEYPHYQNFIDAIRAGDPKLLDVRRLRRAPVLVAAAPRQHLVPRRPRLMFDGKAETFVDDKKADKPADPRVPEGVRDAEVVHVERTYQQPSHRHRRLRAWPQRGHRRADAFRFFGRPPSPSFRFNS